MAQDLRAGLEIELIDGRIDVSGVANYDKNAKKVTFVGMVFDGDNQPQQCNGIIENGKLYYTVSLTKACGTAWGIVSHKHHKRQLNWSE